MTVISGHMGADLPLRPIIVWSPIATPHWTHTLSHLGRLVGAPIRMYVDDQPEDPSRRQFAWAADVSATDGVAILPRSQLGDLAKHDWTGFSHLVCNPFNHPGHRALLGVLDHQGADHALQMSMPGLDAGPVGRWLRAALYRFNFSRIANRARFILTHGAGCAEWLRAHGVHAKAIRPGGYFVPGIATEPPAAEPGSMEPVRFAYLGQFIERKRIASLVNALTTMPGRGDWTLDAIGAGPDLSTLQARTAGLPITIKPPVPYHQVIPTLAQYHALVLPSRADEWGVVVNEAIHAGCAVVVSSGCGSADLIANGGPGIVVADPLAAAKAMMRLCDDRASLAAFRLQSRMLSPRITSAAGATYLHQLFHMQTHPAPPWRGMVPS